jgi:hypothetical protein
MQRATLAGLAGLDALTWSTFRLAMLVGWLVGWLVVVFVGWLVGWYVTCFSNLC